MRKLLIFTALFLAVCFYFNQREFPVHQNGIVVISGASTGMQFVLNETNFLGIGFHAAFELANQGYYVIAGLTSNDRSLFSLLGVRNEKALKNLEQEAKRFGGKNGKVAEFFSTYLFLGRAVRIRCHQGRDNRKSLCSHYHCGQEGRPVTSLDRLDEGKCCELRCQ